MYMRGSYKVQAKHAKDKEQYFQDMAKSLDANQKKEVRVIYQTTNLFLSVQNSKSK